MLMGDGVKETIIDDNSIITTTNTANTNTTAVTTKS